MAYKQSGPSYAKLFEDLTSSQLRQREYERRAEKWYRDNQKLENKQSVEDFMKCNIVHEVDTEIISAFYLSKSNKYQDPDYYLSRFKLKCQIDFDDNHNPIYVSFIKEIKTINKPDEYIDILLGLTFEEANDKMSNIISRAFNEIMDKDIRFHNHIRRAQLLQSIEG